MTFSIITINYNNREGLERTIESVLSQTFRDYEYIVVDGGSTDGSVEVIKQHASRIKQWVSEPDGGIYNAMNKGLRMAKGDYINFINSGDCFSDDSILRRVSKSIRRDTGFLYGDHFDYIPGSVPTFHPCRPFWMFETPFMHKGFCHQSSFVKRELALQHPFDERLKIAADYKMFYELYTEGVPYVYIPYPICIYENTGTSQRHHKLAFREDAIIRGVYPGLPYLYHYIQKFYYYPLKSRILDFVRGRK
jgi:glycosyltransferase involved in cell wall biosynthesis